MSSTRITVRGDSPYDVVVGEGLLGEPLPTRAPEAARANGPPPPRYL